MMSVPQIFCNKCDTLILDAGTCPGCGWKRLENQDNSERLVWNQSVEAKLGEPYTKFTIIKNILIVCAEKKNNDRTRTGIISAFDINDGRVLWRFPLDEGRVSRFLTKAGEYLLVGSQDMRTLPDNNNKLISLDGKTGEIVWDIEIVAHSLSPVTVLDGVAFFTTNNYKGVAIDIVNGSRIWEIDELPAWSPEPPTAGDSQFLFGSRDPILTIVDAKKGIKDTFYTGKDPFLSEFAVKDNSLFAPCWDKYLYAFEISTRNILWKIPLGRGASSPPTIGKHLYIGVKETSEGKPVYGLWAVDIDSGDLIWKFRTAKHILAPPTILEDSIIVASRDGNIYEIDSDTGEEQWSFKVDGQIVSQPIYTNNLISIGTREGQIYTIYRNLHSWSDLDKAETYRANKQWDLAGVTSALAGDFSTAGKDFEILEEPYKAAQLFEYAHDWEKSAALYLSINKTDQAIHCYRKAENRAGEAKSLIIAKRFEEAGELYKSIEDMAEAASAYEKAGRLNQAAVCYEAAGEKQTAIKIYLALQKPESAAQIYIENGDTDKAVEVYKEFGLTQRAADVLRKDGRLTDAVEVLAQKEQWEDAAKIWLEEGEIPSAAKLFERAKRWVRAADLWLESKEYNRAAELYRQIGDLSKAANLYEQIKDIDTATNLYNQLKDANSLKRLSRWEDAAVIYLQTNPPLEMEAAKCFEQAGIWSKSAELYANIQMYEKSARCWLNIDETNKALEMSQLATPSDNKAKLLEELGAIDEAVLVWIEIEQPNEAVNLYIRTGRTQEAFDLLIANKAWRKLKELANDLNEYEQEARACIELARDASWDRQVDLYFSAGQSLVRAARKYEDEQSRDEAIIANLWEEAADCFEKAFEKDSVAECNNEARRLRKEPLVEVTMMTEGSLFAEQWGYLHINVKNVGYGPAFLISFRIISDLFEGQDFLHSKKIRGLREGKNDVIKLRVRPKLEALGEAAPLDVELSYSLPNRNEFTRVIRGVVTVKQASSQQITPVNLTPNSTTSTGNTIVYVYSDDSRIIARSPELPEDQKSGSNEKNLEFMRKYRELLSEFFDRNELQTLCFDLGVPHDHLTGTTVPTKAEALVRYCYQRGNLTKLRERILELRPQLNLPKIQ